MGGCIDGWAYRWVGERMGGLMNGCMNGFMRVTCRDMGI